MYETEQYENLSDAQKTVATYLDSLNLDWKPNRAIYVPDGEGGVNTWTIDFHLRDLGTFVGLLTGSDEDKAMIASVLKYTLYWVHLVDIDKPDWQEAMKAHLDENVKELKANLERLENEKAGK